MLYDITKIKEDTLLSNYGKARHKFVWFADEIKTYPEVILAAVEDTLRFFAITEKKVTIDDIGCFGIRESATIKSLFFLYIGDRRFSGFYSLYKEFRERYHCLARGTLLEYEDVGINIKGIDHIEQISRDDTQQISDKSKEYLNTLRQNAEVLQNYKRKITRFETLANKSLNRRRKVPLHIRFQVLKRDKLTCQSCGRSAPGVKLEVDHKKSILDGGSNEMFNLWTLCYDCNRGKGPTTLWDEILEKIRTIHDSNHR